MKYFAYQVLPKFTGGGNWKCRSDGAYLAVSVIMRYDTAASIAGPRRSPKL